MVNRVMILVGDLHLTHRERKTDIYRPNSAVSTVWILFSAQIGGQEVTMSVLYKGVSLEPFQSLLTECIHTRSLFTQTG